MMSRPIFAFLLVLLGALPATAAPIALSGRVVDADGEPLAEAAVRLLPILGPYASGERELAGGLEVVIPSLGEESRAAWVEITASGGQPWRRVYWRGAVTSRFQIFRGRGTIQGPPSGVWNLGVTGPDGQSWTTTATTTAGQVASVTVE